MSLRDRLNDIQQQPTKSLDPRELRVEEDHAYQELKSTIHSQLLERIDLAAMEKMPEDRLRVELKVLVEQMLAEQGTVLNQDERARRCWPTPPFPTSWSTPATPFTWNAAARSNRPMCVSPTMRT